MSTAYVAALFLGCLVSDPSKCSMTSVQVEPRACHLPAIRGRVVMNGEWQDAVFRVKCDASKRLD
jgi:hypothetical protein